MSSHHIIREKQEPAILIMSFDGFSSENLGQLLEWSPTVIIDHAIYEEADSYGIKIDVVIAADTEFAVQANTKIVLSEGDELEDGLKYLTGEGYPAVNVITDKFALKDYALFVDLIDLVIYTSGKKIYPVKSGFSKWLSVAEDIEIYNEAINLHMSGLTKVSDKLYRTVKDGFFVITFDQDFIFISENIL